MNDSSIDCILKMQVQIKTIIPNIHVEKEEVNIYRVLPPG